MLYISAIFRLQFLVCAFFHACSNYDFEIQKITFHFQHYDKRKVLWLSHSDIPLWQLLGGLRSLSVLGDMSKHTLDSIAISVFEEVSIGWFGQKLCQYLKPLQFGGLSVIWY